MSLHRVSIIASDDHHRYLLFLHLFIYPCQNSQEGVLLPFHHAYRAYRAPSFPSLPLSPHLHPLVPLQPALMPSFFVAFILQVISSIFVWDLAFVCARSVNITIDDTYGDPVTGAQFTYAGGWNVGPTCTSCTARPDPSQVYNGTWHDGTFFPSEENAPLSATVSFTGRLIWRNAITGTYDNMVYRNCGLCLLHPVPDIFRPGRFVVHAVRARRRSSRIFRQA